MERRIQTKRYLRPGKVLSGIARAHSGRCDESSFCRRVENNAERKETGEERDVG